MAAKPHILLICDVPDWIFARHCHYLSSLLADDFRFSIKTAGQSFDESEFDLIAPLEWNLIDGGQARNPRKYVTGVRSHVSWQDQPFDRLIRYLQSQFAEVHVVSDCLARIFGPYLNGLTNAPHGIDTDLFSPLEDHSPLQSSTESFRVGWAGNKASPVKGFAEFIEPLGEIPGVEVVSCGYRERHLNLEEMRSFYGSIDAYICSSLIEGHNNGIMEAAAMRLPIITTNNGTVPEYLVHGESAIIINREASAFTTATTVLRDTPALAKMLGANARKAVTAKFDWKKCSEVYRQIFHRVIDNNRTESNRNHSPAAPSPTSVVNENQWDRAAVTQ